MKVVRRVTVEYSDDDDVLQVLFRKPNGTPFIGQNCAEEWFGKKIELSPHLGQKIVTKNMPVHCHVSCTKCTHVDYFEKYQVFIGPESLFKGEKPLPTSTVSRPCPCGGIRQVEMRENLDIIQ